MLTESEKKKYDCDINVLTPDFHDIHIKNIVVENCRCAFNVKALPERALRNVLTENLAVRGRKFMTMQDVSSMTVTNSSFDCDDMTGSLTGCSGMMFLNCEFSKITIFAKDKIKSIS